jgi:hypothetical protein
MSNNGNGTNLEAPSDAAAPPQPITPEAAASAIEQQLDPVVRQVIGTMIRGLLVSAPGIQPHILLNSIARQTGSLLAGAVTSDLATVLTLRKGMKDAFGNGVAKEKITQPPIPQGPSMTVVRKG